MDEPDIRLRHAIRFRKVSNRYPRQVAYAYDGDLARAEADSDEQVAATVAAWEREQGMEPRDWTAIGRDEGRGEDDEKDIAAWVAEFRNERGEPLDGQ